jgi:hypothetical protein
MGILEEKSVIQSVWILTYAINEYNQEDDDYFLAVFPKKPTHQQLTKLGIEQNQLHHVLNGGGRKKVEHKWYYLNEHKLIDELSESEE